MPNLSGPCGSIFVRYLEALESGLESHVRDMPLWPSCGTVVRAVCFAISLDLGFGASASKPSPRTNTGVLGYLHGCLRPIRGRRAGGSGWSPGISTFCRIFWSTKIFFVETFGRQNYFSDP